MNGIGIWTDEGLEVVWEGHRQYPEAIEIWKRGIRKMLGAPEPRKNCLHERQLFVRGGWMCKDCREVQ